MSRQTDEALIDAATGGPQLWSTELRDFRNAVLWYLLLSPRVVVFPDEPYPMVRLAFDLDVPKIGLRSDRYSRTLLLLVDRHIVRLHHDHVSPAGLSLIRVFSRGEIDAVRRLYQPGFQ